jgi:hypothetical protein
MRLKQVAVKYRISRYKCLSIRLTGRWYQSIAGRVQLKCDGTRWRTGGELKGKQANGVGSQYHSHYLGTLCIQHYYRSCAHLDCQKSTELTPHFKWTRPFRRKTKSGFCACTIIFQMQYTTNMLAGSQLFHTVFGDSCFAVLIFHWHNYSSE